MFARFQRVCEIAFALLFIYAAFSKIKDGEFARYLIATGMCVPQAAAIVSSVIIGSEVIAAVFLIAFRARALGWLFVAFLSTAFIVVHVALAALGDVVPCGCIGFRRTFSGTKGHLLMAVFSVLALGVAAMFYLRTPSSILTDRVIGEQT